jgi:hypothetical protein
MVNIYKTNRHLILDLDATVIHSLVNYDEFQRLKVMKDPELRPRFYFFKVIDMEDGTHGKGIESYTCGVFRPHVHNFIEFASKYFDKIFLWSAGLNGYVYAIQEEIFYHSDIKPSLIWSRSDCVKKNGIFYKPLSKFYKYAEKFGANATNTLILDDNELTFVENISNAIHIPVYEVEKTTEDNDGNSIIIEPVTKKKVLEDDICLLQFSYWLCTKDVLNAKDIRKTNKKYIFKTSLESYIEQINKENNI